MSENHAITYLENTLAILKNNEPINRSNGFTEQADLELASICDIEEALSVLDEIYSKC